MGNEQIERVPSADVEALVAIGGNLGDCRHAFNMARERLNQHGVQVLASSPLYRTKPIGGPADQPDYLNAVLRVTTRLSPLQLLDLCLELERQAGRQRLERWGARTLDLDLLSYHHLVCATPHLSLPHPRMHQRRFVLAPLCDLLSSWQHPILRETAETLLSHLSAEATDDAVQCIELSW